MYATHFYKLTVRFMVYSELDRRWVTKTEQWCQGAENISEAYRFVKSHIRFDRCRQEVKFMSFDYKTVY